MFCAYNGEEYFYCDENGPDGPGIYRMKDGAAGSLLTNDYYYASRLEATGEYLYRLNIPRLSETSLATGQTKQLCTETGPYYYDFTVDADEVFALRNDGKESDFDYHLYRFEAGGIVPGPGADASGLERIQTELPLNGLYTVRHDDQYWYIYRDSETGPGYAARSITGIVDKAENRQVFRNMLSNSISDGQSLIYFRDDKMIFSDSINHVPNAFSMVDAAGYEEYYVTFGEGYQYDLNNIYNDRTYIYALLQKQLPANNFPRYNSVQLVAQSDALVRVDADTGSVTTLYEAESGEERVIGFANQKAYLFQVRTNLIECLDVATGKREDFLQLETVYRSYSFEMCGKKLFVWGSEDFAEFFPTDFVGAFDCVQ
jgi:hypothetical protein